MDELVELLSHKTPLRHGLTRRRAADLWFVLTGPSLYRDLVLEAGWAPADWAAWVSDTLTRNLFTER